MTLRDLPVETGIDRPHCRPGEPIIEIKDFTFQYKAQSKPTLININLKIHEGEKIGIVGQSGSGKTTLAHLINGLIPHRYRGDYSGSVRVAGTNPQTSPLHETSKVVGTVLQDPDGQFIGLTVAEDIAFALENDLVPTGKMHKKVAEAAALVGIENKLEASPQDLSGGQKQKASMAGVLVDDVKILLFDEPLASLDPAAGKKSIKTIDRLCCEKRTIIIIEHRIEDILRWPLDRIIVMAEGEIIADASPDEIIASRVLIEHGIREPLYVSALRLAGQEVTAADAPSSIKTVRIEPAVAAKLQSWGREPRQWRDEQKPLLEVRNIKLDINETKILKGINATIYQGEVVALCGTNGAGKSSLAKVICGFEKPDAGEIWVSGMDFSEATITRRGREIGFVLQNPNQMISKPVVHEEVELALATLPMDEDEKAQRLEQALRICGLWPYRNWPISALSYGQKKRVTIASALVTTPKMIILDEPTAGQDWAHYTEIMEFLRKLNQQGVTIMLITHDMHLALEYADRALVMAKGKIIAQQTSAEVLANPELTKRASLLTTSLHALAQRVQAPDPSAFIEQFIEREAPWRQQILDNNRKMGRSTW